MSIEQEIVALKYMRHQMHQEDDELVLLKLQGFCLAASIIMACQQQLFITQQERAAS